MKIKVLLIFLFSSLSTLPAQKLYHALGITYSEWMGAYGNYDIASITYTPQVQWQQGRFNYGFSFPASIGKVVSAAREPNRAVMEIPASGEVSFNPLYPHVPFRSLNVYAGAGVSRIYFINTTRTSQDMANGYLGFRMRAADLRFTISRSIYGESYRRLYRVGFGLFYSFK